MWLDGPHPLLGAVPFNPPPNNHHVAVQPVHDRHPHPAVADLEGFLAGINVGAGIGGRGRLVGCQPRARSIAAAGAAAAGIA